jgi:hypothetical protein
MSEDRNEVKRVFKGEQTVHHDLFQLQPEKVRKNVGYDPKKPIIEEYDHIHWFHSFDSSGRPQKYSSPQAGHIHEVEWEVVDGKPTITKVGPPLSSTSKKLGKNRAADPSGHLRDNHVHEAVYRYSEVLNIRRLSEEAQRAIAERANEDARAMASFNSANQA